MTKNPRPRRSARAVALLCAAALLLAGVAPFARAQSPNTLPALGDSASNDLSVGDERRIGEQIMREIRRDPDYLEDPILLEYLQSLWQPLLAAARARGEVSVELDLRYTFEPFLVRDRSVNAFALPGGFVGVHLGLIAMTTSRDELASVLAHELSHVTQRHIARSIAPSRNASILGVVTTILGMLAASRSANPSAANAVIAGGQAAAIQTQLNFSRDMEREADRVGYGVMTQAGYSAGGMAAMFEKLDKSSRLNDSGNYPYLRSHPLTVERIGEARARMGPSGAVPPPTGSLLEHATMQARARVLMDPRIENLRRWEGMDARAAQTAGAANSSTAPRPVDAGVEQLPDVLVQGFGGSRAERLGIAYASALAASLLRNWAQADSALAMAQSLGAGQGAALADERALRQVRLLHAQSLVERGDGVAAAAMLAPLRSEASRPVLLLQAQAALVSAAGAPGAIAEPGSAAAGALRASADALQTWVATSAQDASAWKALGQVWARLGQPMRALRADAESQLAIGDVQGAIDRLRAAQRLARSGGPVDFIEASVVDSRLRAIEAQRRALMAEGRKGNGEPPP